MCPRGRPIARPAQPKQSPPPDCDNGARRLSPSRTHARRPPPVRRRIAAQVRQPPVPRKEPGMTSPLDPFAYLPGSEKKILALRERALARLPLFEDGPPAPPEA